MNTETYCE